jgi:hypothetical protein
MERIDSSRGWLRLGNADAVRFLADPKARHFLEPFLGRERSASEVAVELGVAVNSVLYRVQRMRALGLLEVVRVEPRRGRPIKHYRTVADAFLIPFSSTTAATLEALYTQTFENLRHQLFLSVLRAWEKVNSDPRNWGAYLARDERGSVSYQILPTLEPADIPAAFEHLLSLESPAVLDNTWMPRLGLEDAKALQRDLWALRHRYGVKSLLPGGKTYIVHTAIAPLDED